MPEVVRLTAAIVVLGVLAVLEANAAEPQCKHPGFVWEAWRDHVLATNPGTDFFELRGDGRDEIVRAYNCAHEDDKCPPDKVMVFHCMGNTKVLIAFVKKGCVTIAKDELVEDYRRIVRGGLSC